MPLDIATGIFIALGASEWIGVELSSTLLFIALISALLPDFDLLFDRIVAADGFLGRVIGGHRGLLHAPAFYVLPSIIIYLAFGSLWASIFALGVFLHLLHDTFFLGWGIAWLWPFSHRRFKFFPDKDGRITSRPVLSWLPEEEASIRAEWGSRHWIRDFYLRPSIVSILEYGAFVISFVALFLYI
jgi:hypothetical protein